MQATTATLDQWESAWAAYVEAEDIFRHLWRERHVRGRRRAWNNACTRRRQAIEVLKKLDSEFCERMGIK